MTATWRGLVPIALLLAALPGAAEEPRGWFPLEDGLTWTYSLQLRRGAESQQIEYRARVARREEVGGLSCAVIEARSGERLLESTWFGWDGKRLRNPRRQTGRAPVELREGTGPAGRLFLDLAALEAAPGAEPVRWEWTAADGSAKGTIVLEKHETLDLPGLGPRECLVLLETAELQAGERRATQERRLWLAEGLGMVQERCRFAIAGAEATETVAVLLRKPERS